jgi:hypothetical protein
MSRLKDAMDETGMTEDEIAESMEEDLIDATQRIRRLEAALREVEAHHVEQNRIKGRDESRSTTLRIVRSVLSTSSEPK